MTPNPTMSRFGYPDTLIHEYTHWVVLLREEQVTLGSLVLCTSSDSTAFSQLPPTAFSELCTVVNDIESALRDAVRYDKINYLMLMMSDPNVHFHVLPRYATPRSACGLTIADGGWPRAPNLAEPLVLDPSQRDALCQQIRQHWNSR